MVWQISDINYYRNKMKLDYPFSAIVGQKTMKQALILTAIDPLIGGVLVFGERGTGNQQLFDH